MSLEADFQAHHDKMEGEAAIEKLESGGASSPSTDAKPIGDRAQAALQTGASKMVDAAKDIGTGLVELPRAIVKGVRDSYQSMFDLGNELNRHIADRFPDSAMTRPIVRLGGDFPYAHQADANAAESEFTLPDINAPKSVTGNLEKNAVQFITSLGTVGKQFKALGLPTEVSGWAGRGLSAVKGFAAMFEGFDGANQRLSDLVQSVPALRNPVTDFLASKPDDSEAVGRLKNAVEGTLGAQLVDGVVAGIRYLHAANATKAAMAPMMEMPEEISTPVGKGIEALGDPEAPPQTPLTEVVSKLDAQRARAAAFTAEDASKLGEPNYPDEVAGKSSPGAMEAGTKEPGVYVNFARIDTSDDVKRAMSELTTHFKDNIDEARRGVRSFEQTKLGAQSVDAWNTLMSRRAGEPLNAEASLAARQLWATASAKVLDLSKIATQEPTPENLFAFRKMLETHAAIQQEVIAARTETARALSSWRIPAGTTDERMTGILQSLNGEAGMKGGIETSLSLAYRVKALAEAGDIDSLNNFAAKGAYATTRDAVLEAWTNGLLTSPMTHVKVTVSNAATAVLRLGETKIAENISALVGDQNGVQLGEAAAQYAGLIGGLKDTLRYVGKTANSLLNDHKLPDLGDDPLSNAIKAAKSGAYSIGEEPRPEWMSQGNVSSQAFGMANSGWLGNAIDLAGQIIRSPGKALQGEHDFFRSIAYRMELNRLATRQATMEVNGGQLAEEGLGNRIQDLINTPPRNLKIGAMDGMRYQTFTDAPGKMAMLLQQARQDFPMLRVILPFYKIPSRIMSFTFERGPLAPLMSTFRQNIAAGGSQRSLALAQVGLGTGIMLATADAVMSGQITGSGPVEKGQRQAQENEGWKPYSIKVGERWVQYNHLETVGGTMAMAADAMETMQNFHAGINGDDPDVENLALATTLSVAQDITSKTYLQGLANFFDALSNPKGEGQKVLKNLAGSIVPAGVSTAAHQLDPYKRATYSMMDAIKARTPGLSKSLPPQQNLWGEPVKQGSGLGIAYDLLSPMPSGQTANEPIDKELIKQGMNITRPPARTAFNGATIDLAKDPALYSHYQALAGNELKHVAWGVGAKDLLNAIVSGEHPLSTVYNLKSDGPDGGKADMIKDILNQYRNQAKTQLLQENPDLQAKVSTKQEAKRALKLPVLQ